MVPDGWDAADGDPAEPALRGAGDGRGVVDVDADMGDPLDT
jgi:hypothetical protein